MKTSASTAALFGAALLFNPLLSVAALPTGTLEFLTPNATVGANDIIDVRLRLTLDAASAPLTFSSNPLTGFAAADLPLQGTYTDPVTGVSELRNFATYTNAYLNTFYQCSGSFTDVCSPSANYSFEFWLTSTPGNPSVNFVNSFELPAGQSTEYLFGRFIPAAGGAAAGTYTFFNSGLTVAFEGEDVNGNFLRADDITLAASCSSETADCAFTRTVGVVPEPGTYGLMALGLLGVCGAARRRAAQSH